jgi:DNA-binding MarR family transcriptional regulator
MKLRAQMSRTTSHDPAVSPAVRAYRRLLRVHATATRCLSARLLADHGLSINDYEALDVLSRAEGGLLKRVELARSLVLSPSGVTRLLEGLEEAGLVERAPCSNDLRVTYARLTKDGAARLGRASLDHEISVAALLEEHLSDEEIESLGDLLGKLPRA